MAKTGTYPGWILADQPVTHCAVCKFTRGTMLSGRRAKPVARHVVFRKPVVGQELTAVGGGIGKTIEFRVEIEEGWCIVVPGIHDIAVGLTQALYERLYMGTVRPECIEDEGGQGYESG